MEKMANENENRDFEFSPAALTFNSRMFRKHRLEAIFDRDFVYSLPTYYSIQEELTATDGINYNLFCRILTYLIKSEELLQRFLVRISHSVDRFEMDIAKLCMFRIENRLSGLIQQVTYRLSPQQTV